MTNTVGFIFARGGSKGLPRKNILPLQGKPLIAWAIEHALAVKKIERLIVSTDSEEIATVALQYGAEIPFMRPRELAQDNTPEWLAWRHALNYLIDTDGCLPKTMVSIPTTAPLRLPIDIENCLIEYEKGNSDVIITITEAHRSPYFNMVKVNLDGHVALVIPSPQNIARRQDTPSVYDITTVCYVMDPIFVMSHTSIFEGRVRSVYVPKERSLDIDTPIDFQIAEVLFNPIR
ncbi:MAG: acylneuraminate cytidylyltransferase family protein [Thiothrix sp.]|nr:MAG: acylneuraminate cytidylyltransferase family protein [Thiothrix sp.]